MIADEKQLRCWILKMGQKTKFEDSIVCRFAGKELSVRAGSSVPTRKSQIQALVKYSHC